MSRSTPRIIHLRQAGLETSVEAGELAAGRCAPLRHLRDIRQCVHRAVEREELLIVLLRLGVAGRARAERHFRCVEKIGGAENLGILRGIVGVGRIPGRIVQ